MMIVMIMMVMIKMTTCLWMSPALATSILFKITLLFIESFFGGDAGSRRSVSGNSSSSNSIISTSSSEKLLLALVLAARPFLGGLNWATILVSTCSWGEQKYNSFEELTFRLIYLTHEIWRKPTINGHTSSSKLEVMLLRALAAADLGEGIFDFGLVRLVDGKEVERSWLDLAWSSGGRRLIWGGASAKVWWQLLKSCQWPPFYAIASWVVTFSESENTILIEIKSDSDKTTKPTRLGS